MQDCDPMQEYLPKVITYLKENSWPPSFKLDWRQVTVEPLAKGEYNLNYILHLPDCSYVFRVNISSQIGRADQISYEYKALKLLTQSGVTPLVYYVDDSRALIDKGVLIMQYLPGRPLDYKGDLLGAATTFAAIHQTHVSSDENHLIVEAQPLTLIYNECARLLENYFSSELAHPEIASYLYLIMEKMEKLKEQESYFADNPYFCIVNTEVNSGNFIVNEEQNTTHLVDWEMVRWGDPSSDLCHFLSPLTTLWKSNFRFNAQSRKCFLDAYKKKIVSAALRDSLEERLALKFPFVYLRGISWSAMGWVAYQSNYAGIRNDDTWQKLKQYMNLEFIQSIFEPYNT